MDTRKTLLTLALATAAMGVGLAQNTVRGLEDLVGVRSAMGEYHLKQRGYALSHSDKASHATFHYYSKAGECVVVESEGNRFESIRPVASANCRDEWVRYDKVSANGLQDLVGVPARNGEYQMQQRGYTFTRAEKFRQSDFHYYSNGADCVVAEVYDGRYESVRQTLPGNCNKSVSGIFQAQPEDPGIDYPRVRADTDGGGSYYVPGSGSSQVDRGYAWFHEDRPMIGFSYQGERHAKFYGPITRRINDQVYEMSIEDSNFGPATGKGTVRLTRDHQEVEIVKVEGSINGRRFTGNFERAWMEEKRKAAR